MFLGVEEEQSRGGSRTAAQHSKAETTDGTGPSAKRVQPAIKWGEGPV